MADNSVQIVIGGELDDSLLESAEMASGALSKLGSVAVEAGAQVSRSLNETSSAAKSATSSVDTISELTKAFRELSSGGLARLPASVARLGLDLGVVGETGALALGGVTGLAVAVGTVAYQAVAAHEQMENLAAGFALTGRGAQMAGSGVEHETQFLAQLPGSTQAASDGFMRLAAQNASWSAALVNQTGQLLPAFIHLYGDDAPQALAKLTGSLSDLSEEGFRKLDHDLLNLPPHEYEVIDGLIRTGQQAQAVSRILADLGRSSGTYVKSLGDQVYDTEQEIARVKAALQGEPDKEGSEYLSILNEKLASIRHIEQASAQQQQDGAYKSQLASAQDYNDVLDKRGAILRRITQYQSDLQQSAARSDKAGEQAFSTAIANKQSELAALNKSDGSGSNGASRAREEANRIIEIDKQLHEAAIEGQKQENAAKLALGQESLGAYTAEALREAQAKYDAAVQGINREVATGKATKAEGDAEMLVAAQQYSNAENQIMDQTAEKQRQLDDKSFADFQKKQEDKVKAVQAANEAAMTSGQITPVQKDQGDLGAVSDARKAVDDQFATLTAGWDQQSAAYKAVLAMRNAYDEQAAEKSRQIEQKLSSDQIAQWRTTDQQIESAESQLVSNIFSKRQGLGADLRQVGLKTLEDEIQTDLKALTEHELVNLKMLASDQAASKEGMLFKAGQYLLDKAGLITTETAKTAAVATGQGAQNSATASGAAAGKAISLAAAESQIATDAAVAGAGAMAATAMIPYVGPIMAGPAGAAAYAATMAYAGLASAEGGQYLVPYDGQPTLLHEREMVMQRSLADPMRSFFESGAAGKLSDGAGAGGDVHNHFHLTSLNTRDLESMVRSNMSLFNRVARNQARNGVRP
jgi:hypothetical protein